MNIPNIITLFRIFLIPIYLYFFYSGMEKGFLYAGIVFVIAGISDILDGHIARKYDLTSKLGALLDPLADKLFVFAILITFSHRGIIPSWILMAMGVKEIAMIIGASILLLFGKRTVIPANRYGKLATVSFYISIISIIINIPFKYSKMFLIITVLLNLLALINYLLIFLRVKDEKIRAK